MSEKTYVSDLQKLEKAARDFLEITKKIGEHHNLAALDPSERQKVHGFFREVIGESQRIMGALHVFCQFCRTVTGEIFGSCAQCGEEVCSSCGVKIEDKFVHKDVCARFFPG